MSLKIAKEYVDTHWHHADATFIGGSHVASRAKSGSDVDIVIISDTIPHYYRESLLLEGCPLELFVYNQGALQTVMVTETYAGVPFMSRLTAEGILYTDQEGIGSELLEQARLILKKGPHPLSQLDISSRRYAITDTLVDFEDDRPAIETIYVLQQLLHDIQEFVCRTNGRWTGQGKWAGRELAETDPLFCQTLEDALFHYQKTGQKEALISCIDQQLNLYGGRLFHGYTE
ncbi:nucleotidyltransferase domain-containing protein [Aureibacillus halotolerans]|uniref:Nucleotidyltransferase-like protein n=1 Tax=Aureibacillus halotolerans TaxID=1508390 RepID=A0A4R6UER3_9BACI|nr:nucleotidyltransferase domain-containing protein [Aureibacillus halotolerans]TDQ41584.1 hypothetical protein EV213_103162 [Aureibacillus halotolerans]